MRKSINVIFILVIILFFINDCGYNGREENSFKKISVKFSVGEGEKRIDFVMDLNKNDIIFEDKKVVLENSISDFTIPFNKIGSTLKRKEVAGEELINKIEIIGDTSINRTSIICRFTTKGTGGGKGKIGISLIAAFYLDKYIFSKTKGDLFQLHSSGKLTSSEGKLNKVNGFIKTDMELAGTKSKSYTMLASIRDSNSFFHGFVIFDPTNPKSLGNAYFEFTSSESSVNWKLSEQK
jgi:hypothetical protein